MKGMIAVLLKIEPEALQKIQKQLTADQKLLLDLDDGVGELSKVGYCTLDTNFRLLIVPENIELKDYQAHFDSELGPVYYKGYSDTYFDGHEVLSLNPRNQILALKNNGGAVDDRVQIVVLDPAALAK
ncbi:conserved hypothetical protein [Latilactobacillus fuchuensis]|uniref:Core domain-containing protein n=2 Tax=Latilactobacillus fuchuensis TaxID=164393 RepID=A0A2N9DSX5_9LACO|nr:conserved hypothetical protein [Latilactobacillus fuchuensis]